jgi:hypothetical protein
MSFWVITKVAQMALKYKMRVVRGRPSGYYNGYRCVFGDRRNPRRFSYYY